MIASKSLVKNDAVIVTRGAILLEPDG